ncbi:Transglycosylase SLT domain-containing protein [Devosia enhydra]|uniref:Transglycosylase SLT domain-containing protein n=2 Tax=Devosia enhydra TaxID=665118 RepID=A0A1K2I3F8_9HYPH|nr:Transglycosylase SLT domain-containing protein [Devosia enhydra]
MPQGKTAALGPGAARIATASLAPAPATRSAEPLAFAATPSTSGRGEIDRLIGHYSHLYGVPVSLVRRVVQRESTFNPKARNGPYWGLMQIRHDTARSMGYSGPASGLLDADTNLRYAVKYLRGAWLVGGKNENAAIRHYSRGYYYEAKRLGLLEETGLR